MTTKFIKCIRIQTPTLYVYPHGSWVGTRWGIKLEDLLLLDNIEAVNLYLAIIAELQYTDDILCQPESTHWRLYKIIK